MPKLIHGHARAGKHTRTYRSWKMMRKRCYLPTTSGYENYGGRGIAVCKRWRNNFAAFLADMGERPAGKMLDRIKNDRDYKPSNCRWATWHEQSRNRRDTKFVTYKNERMCVRDWEIKFGLPRSSLRHWLNKGLSVMDAVKKAKS